MGLDRRILRYFARRHQKQTPHAGTHDATVINGSRGLDWEKPMLAADGFKPSDSVAGA